MSAKNFLGTLYVDPPLAPDEHAAVLALDKALRLSISHDGSALNLAPDFESWDSHTSLTKVVEHLGAAGRFVYLNGWRHGGADRAEDWFAIGSDALVRGFEGERMPHVPKPWLERWERDVRTDHIAGPDLGAFQRLTFEVLLVAVRLGGPLDAVAAAFEALVTKIGDLQRATALMHEFEWIALDDIELGSDPNWLPYRQHWGALGAAVVQLVLARIATVDQQWAIRVDRLGDDVRPDLVDPLCALVELAATCAPDGAQFMLERLIEVLPEEPTRFDDVGDNVLWTLLEWAVEDRAPGQTFAFECGLSTVARVIPRLVRVAGTDEAMMEMLAHLEREIQSTDPAWWL